MRLMAGLSFPCLVFSSDGKFRETCQPGRGNGGRGEAAATMSSRRQVCSASGMLCGGHTPQTQRSFLGVMDGGSVTEPEAWTVQDKPWDLRPLRGTPVLGC